MQFKMLSGDINWKTYGGKFVSKRLNNGDFDYWLVLEVINMWDATGDESQDQYAVQLLAISPDSVSQENMDRAFESCGWEQADESNPLVRVEVLADYGIFSNLWNATGNNIHKLLKEAHKQASLSSMLFGFYMDRPKNRLGQTGWDLIKGQDIREFLANK